MEVSPPNAGRGRLAALEPIWNAVFLDGDGLRGNAGAAHVLLRDDVDRRLRPGRGRFDVGVLEHDGSVGAFDRGMGDAVRRVVVSGVARLDLHY